MEENNKRIAKNTIYLYIRMLVIMALSFISTRIVLEKLGSSDYGIYTLVGGFVAMFAVLNRILNTSTSRFLALAIGKGDFNLQKRTFSTALSLHVIIAIIIIVVLEIGGIWFLNNKLNIAPDRMWAARWVFHISVFNVFWEVTQAPFSAAVTSHEHFNMYAIMSVYDAMAKIAVLYCIVVSPFDKLVIYSLLNMVVCFTSVWIYRVYCVHKFPECCFSLRIDKKLYKEMLMFSGWGTLGHVITIINAQGINIILNIFFDTIMNAARGLAHTVNLTIAQFIGGFMTAAQPQLVKFWAAEDKEHFFRLIFNVTQYSIFLLAIIGVPALLEIDYVIKLWLGDLIPEYTVSFVKITLVCGIIYRSNSMIDSGITAAGYVKQLNIVSIPFYLLSIPLFYFVLWMGWGPIVAYWVGGVPPLCAFLANLWIIQKYAGFPSWKYFINIFIKNIVLLGLALVIPWIVQQQMEPGLLRFIVVCGVSVLCTITILYNFALNKETRMMILQKVKKTFHIQ